MSRRGSYAKGVLKREQILSTALSVFATEGYRGTSLRTVAELCDLSLAGLMHYFESKDHLFVEILRRRDAAGLEILAASPARHGLDHVLRSNSAQPGLIELYATMAAAAGDPRHPAAAYFRERYDFLIAHAVNVALPGYDPETVDPELLRQEQARARLAFAVVDGLQTQWLLDRDLDILGLYRDYLRFSRRPLASDIAADNAGDADNADNADSAGNADAPQA